MPESICRSTATQATTRPASPDAHTARRIVSSAAVIVATTALVGPSALARNDTRSDVVSERGVRTIRLLEDGGASGSVDAKPPGQSIGDYFSFHSKLTNLSGRVVGRADALSMRTGKGKATGYLHFVTLTLPRGQITTQNAELLTIQNGNGPEAITGGTGAYKNARGQVGFVERGQRVVVVVRLVG
jgi:hypothetical protein